MSTNVHIPANCINCRAYTGVRYVCIMYVLQGQAKVKQQGQMSCITFVCVYTCKCITMLICLQYQWVLLPGGQAKLHTSVTERVRMSKERGEGVRVVFERDVLGLSCSLNNSPYHYHNRS